MMDGERVIGFLCGAFGCLRTRNILTKMKGGIMIEVDLRGLSEICCRQLQVLVGVRNLCAEHGEDVEWVLDWERDVAKAAKEIRLLREAKGDTLIVKD